MDGRGADGRGESPINSIPPAIAALALVIAGIELVLTLAGRGLMGGARGVGWRAQAIEDYAVFDQIAHLMWARGAFPPEHLLRFVAYPVRAFSASPTRCSWSCSCWRWARWWARSSAPRRRWRCSSPRRSWGALLWAALVDDPYPLFGGYPAVYGLIGAYTFILWTGLGRMGENRMRAFTLIGFLLGIQLIFGLLFGGGLSWVAEVGGFGSGFALSFVLAPGGWAALRERMRRR